MPVLTAPPLPAAPAHIPVESLKQPLESWMPLPNVEVAVVEVALMTGTLIAVYIVEVPEATKLAAPWILNILPGLVVPMPTKPVEGILIISFPPPTS